MEAEKPHIHPQQDGDPGEAVEENFTEILAFK